ncbi:MAG: hypothetical protein ACK51D_03295 [Cyclobacteriaceae bacterium]
MSDEKLKFYLELMKVFSAFIVGTGAGIFGLITTPNRDKAGNSFLVFVALCALSCICFVAIACYLEIKIRK